MPRALTLAQTRFPRLRGAAAKQRLRHQPGCPPTAGQVLHPLHTLAATADPQFHPLHALAATASRQFLTLPRKRSPSAG